MRFSTTSLLTLVSVSMLDAGVALAEQAGGQQQEPLSIQEVVVTGSRLATTELYTPSPVTVLSSDDIQATGVSSAGELVRELPISGARSATDTAGRGNNGSASIALRGLTAVNTLVLMNGRRLLAADAGSVVDTNSLPFEAIERIEILQDGASAVYGTDAITGVVNLIMKDSYEGFSVGGYYGISDHNDAELTNFDLTFGQRFERGGFIFVANHRKQDGYLIADRPCCRDADQRAQGGANLRDPLPVPASFTGIDPTNLAAEFIIREGVTQATSLSDFRSFNYPFTESGPNDAFNYFEHESSMVDSSITNFWFSGHYDFGAGASAFIEVADSRRESLGFLAPDAFGAVYGDPVTVDPNNDFNPFGVAVSAARTIIEQAGGEGRKQDVDAETQRIVLGLRGELGTEDRAWQWELSYNTQELDLFAFNGYVTSRDRLSQAAGDSDECRAAGNGCVPINLFGAAGTITQEMLDFIQVPTFTDTSAKLEALALNVSGPVFSLPAGEVNVAIGAEYREESFDSFNDSFRNNGEIIFNATTVDAHPPLRKVKETYMEVGIPIFESLDLDVALRYSDFSQFGTTTNPKVGLRWRPFDDLLLRGSYGTAFRAPTFAEAFGNQTRGFAGITDPCTGPDFASLPGCNGQQAPAIIGAFVIGGGNPNLDPETADNYTVGFVWTPSALEGLALTIDAFRIKKEDVIASVDRNFIVDQNARFGRFADQVVRDSDNRLQEVAAVLTNLGEQTVKGIDLGIAYQTPTYSVGSFEARLNVAYLDEFSLPLRPGQPSTDLVGIYDTDRGTIAEYRANASVRWNLDKWSAAYSNRFVDSVENVSGFAGRQKVESYLQHDLSVGYSLDAFGTRSQLMLGIENVLDEDPPFVEGNFQNAFDVGTFNSRGRYYSFRASVDF